MDERKRVAEVYNRPDMVAYYDILAQQSGLWKEEQFLIDQYFSIPGKLLIVGCGTGREAFPLQQRGFEITGIDIARQTLLMAKKKQQHVSPAGLSFLQADVVHLPYRDESFENVLMLAQVIQHVPKRRCRRQALGEIFRVLKPGGHCILSTFNKPISLLYLLVMGKQYQQLFLAQTKGKNNQKKWSTVPDLFDVLRKKCDVSRPGESRKQTIIGRLLKRIAWEIRPTIWKYSDPLPITWRVWFLGVCMITNAQRILRSTLNHSSEHILEANDFMLDHREFRFHYFPHKGDLFVHFPDVNEMIEDMTTAGLKLVDYRSWEELRQGQVFSAKVRRSKRLIFYVAQKCNA